jgi:hypothetical protein
VFVQQEVVLQLRKYETLRVMNSGESRNFIMGVFVCLAVWGLPALQLPVGSSLGANLSYRKLINSYNNVCVFIFKKNSLGRGLDSPLMKLTFSSF